MIIPARGGEIEETETAKKSEPSGAIVAILGFGGPFGPFLAEPVVGASRKAISSSKPTIDVLIFIVSSPFDGRRTSADY
jgi:hypothetical protein